MKRIVLVLLALFLLLSSAAYARQTVVTSTNEMKIDLLRYDPSPVQPGDTTDIWFEITNLKDTAINNFDVTFVEDYPFAVVSDKKLTFSTLAAKDKIQFKFTIAVNENAVESENNVFIQYYSRTAGTITSSPFTVNVKKMGSTFSTGVQVSSSEGEVKRIAPGEVADVVVSVANTAGSAMKDVSVKLDLSSSAMPFAPVGMTAEQKLKSIDAGKEEFVSFKLIALPDAAEGVYKIPILIKYYDESGSLFNSSEVVGLVVGSTPKLKLAIESSELTKSTKNGKVVLKLINYGTSDVKFANLKLGAGEGYDIISASEEYIGNVDSDDYETAEFRLIAKADKMTLPVMLDYMDANNKQYSETQNVELMLYTPGELGITTSYTGIYVLAGLLLVVGYFVYRRYKKKKLLK